MKNLILITCVGAALAACASTPQHDDQLEAARAEVRQLGEEPLAHDTADRDLQAARRALQDADAALQQRRPLTAVHHYAYLAERHAAAGEAREAVARALTTRRVPADSLEALGRGRSYPVATNDTPAGRQQNRRVEIVFSDTAGRFAQGEVPVRR